MMRVGVNQIRQLLQLAPLVLVMRIRELAWISALARRLHFDEAHKGLANGNSKIGAGFQIGKGALMKWAIGTSSVRPVRAPDNHDLKPKG
jgi:hypothetical protein